MKSAANFLRRRFLLLLLLWLMAGIGLAPVAANAAPSVAGSVIWLKLNGAIGPASHEYLKHALQRAQQDRAQLVVLQMDTPGGLDSAMRTMVKSIAESSVPVATYVAPTGARAASAGTYILYASHIAAMASGTNLGAATPMQMSVTSSSTSSRQPEDSEHSGTARQPVPAKPVVDDPASQKAINDAVAYLQSLAELRGRNAEWAVEAVREAASLSAREALKRNVIDLMADSLDELMAKLDGRTVIVLGQKRTLQTVGVPIVEILPDWRSRLLGVITNPNVAYILMLIGVYGLILEFYNPGAFLPGIIGAISLLLALYAFQLLPVNYAGMALMVLGVALMVAEAFEPSFGLLGLGGVSAFVIGSIILMDTDAPGYGIHLSIILSFALMSALILIGVVGLALKSRARPVVSGLEQLIGSEARALEDFDHQGHVLLHGELWQANTRAPVLKNQTVKVVGIHNLTLTVTPRQSELKEESL